MNAPFDLTSPLQHFSGWAPLFPLPEVVLFPHILLPVHIFEPRNRRMISDALESDRLIAMALLQPGWETTKTGDDPAIYKMACLGHISVEDRLPDGRYNLVLAGLSRAIVLEEAHHDLAYRVGRLELCSDRSSSQSLVDPTHRQRELLLAFRDLLPQIDIESIFHRALEAEISLGTLCDILAYALPLEPVQAQEILEELDVDRRSELVLQRIRELTKWKEQRQATQEFPPKFSMN